MKTWAAALALLVACNGNAKDEPKPKPSSTTLPEVERAPDTSDAFLARLVPLPDGEPVVIVYDVKGPGGLVGSLELMARPGGWRRENWTLERPNVEGNATRLRGSTIQTPGRMWSAMEGKPETAVWAESPLADLGEAYLALDPESRARAVESLDRWHADLAAARAEHPGDTREVAGTPCLQLEIAAQSLCLWERTGLPLRYVGSQFTVEAVRVEATARVTDATFAIDEAALTEAQKVELPERFRLDSERSLKALVDGDYAALSLVLTPGLRLPLPDADGGW